MDISTITDIKELESMAYREVKALNVAQSNLQAIEQRMAQVQQAVEKPKDK